MTSDEDSRGSRSPGGGRDQPITNLLKSHNVGLSAAKANKILLEKGIIEERTRPSETQPGEIRTYKALTDLGLRYGFNKAQQMVDETTPRYYEDTFEELVKTYLTED